MKVATAILIRIHTGTATATRILRREAGADTEIAGEAVAAAVVVVTVGAAASDAARIADTDFNALQHRV